MSKLKFSNRNKNTIIAEKVLQGTLFICLVKTRPDGKMPSITAIKKEQITNNKGYPLVPLPLTVEAYDGIIKTPTRNGKKLLRTIRSKLKKKSS